METIYDSRGLAVGWLQGEFIYDRRRAGRAFLRSHAVYSLTGRHLGKFEDGYFWDLRGFAAGFITGALGGPPLPLHSLRIDPGSKLVPPPRPAALEPPTRFVRRTSWSKASWSDFLRGLLDA